MPSDRLKQLDYDTPFVPIIQGGKIQPVPWMKGESMEQSVAHLCQQAVFGGYPFAGGLAEVTENGGEIEEEPDKIMVARRTNLMQITRGVITHVPSLQADVSKLTLDFKELLKEIFVQKPDDDATQPVEPVAFLNDSPLGKVSVNGPLNIQQYYNLNGSIYYSKFSSY
jgi:hypothetical protein